jgi:hypothetical protein
LRKEADPKEIRGKRCHLDSCRAGTQTNPGGIFGDRCRCPQGLIARRSDRTLVLAPVLFWYAV